MWAALFVFTTADGIHRQTSACCITTSVCAQEEQEEPDSHRGGQTHPAVLLIPDWVNLKTQTVYKDGQHGNRPLVAGWGKSYKPRPLQIKVILNIFFSWAVLLKFRFSPLTRWRQLLDRPRDRTGRPGKTRILQLAGEALNLPVTASSNQVENSHFSLAIGGFRAVADCLINAKCKWCKHENQVQRPSDEVRHSQAEHLSCYVEKLKQTVCHCCWVCLLMGRAALTPPWLHTTWSIIMS